MIFIDADMDEPVVEATVLALDGGVVMVLTSVGCFGLNRPAGWEVKDIKILEATQNLFV